MRRSVVFPLVLAIFTTWGAANLFAQTQAYFTDIEINTGIAYTPNYSVDNVGSVAGGSPAKWIQIDVEYAPVATKSKTHKDAYAWLENVEIRYEVLIPATVRGNASFVMCNGKVDYWAIKMDGEKNRAIAHIHPIFLERFAPDLRISKRTARDLHIKVSFYANGALVGGSLYGRKDSDKQKSALLFNKVATMMNIVRIPDAVLGRNKTPWAYVNVDHYELIKSKD